MMDVFWKESNIFYNILCFLISENEKLFDRSDSKLYWRTVLNIFTVLHHAYVGYFTQSLQFKLKHSDDGDLRALYTYRIGYLTGWNFIFQTVFLGLSMAHDALEWVDKHQSTLGSRLRYWRDIAFGALVVPYTCFVFGMFWSLYAIDRELVFPRVYDDVIPWWFNQCVHTNILIMVVMETLLQTRRHPTNLKLELSIVAVVTFMYTVVLYSIYFIAHRWLYKIFGIMTWWQVCIYQIGIWISGFVFYYLQFPINRLIHGPEPEIEKTLVQQNGEMRELEKNGDFTGVPSEKSWSLKYRSTREVENSKL